MRAPLDDPNLIRDTRKTILDNIDDKEESLTSGVMPGYFKYFVKTMDKKLRHYNRKFDQPIIRINGTLTEIGSYGDGLFENVFGQKRRKVSGQEAFRKIPKKTAKRSRKSPKKTAKKISSRSPKKNIGIRRKSLRKKSTKKITKRSPKKITKRSKKITKNNLR
jgi:hypothetical protein